jgi:hypothetical protein
MDNPEDLVKTRIKSMNYHHMSDMRRVLWFNPNNIDIYVKTNTAGNNKGRNPYVLCLAWEDIIICLTNRHWKL